MDDTIQQTLRRIEQNDAGLRELWIGYPSIGYTDADRGFKSSDSSDYSRLGAAIGNNTHLETLLVSLDDDEEDVLGAANTEFFDGLKRNSSISNLELKCNQHILIGGVEHEILKSYQKINNNLTRLYINEAVLDNGGGNAITETLRWCTNIKSIIFGYNSITDEQLSPMVEAIKGGCKTSLEHLYLDGNRIGNAGCHALATLLADTNCNIRHLVLDDNQIGNEGATAIANSLANNTELIDLTLEGNQIDQSAVGIFCRLLCDRVSVNASYISNHKLKELVLSDEQEEQGVDHLASLLSLNKGTNKSHVAIKKVLKYHPNMDMEPLFEWDADGESSLKALPYVLDWFKRAKEAVADEDMLADNEDEDDDDYDYRVDEKKLSAILQFAKAMPLLFVPISCIKVDDHRNNKRKRVEK